MIRIKVTYDVILDGMSVGEAATAIDVDGRGEELLRAIQVADVGVMSRQVKISEVKRVPPNLVAYPRDEIPFDGKGATPGARKAMEAAERLIRLTQHGSTA